MSIEKYFGLNTGKVISPRIIGDKLPYPDRVIKRVNQLGKTTRGEKYSDGIGSVIVNVNRSIGRMKN